MQCERVKMKMMQMFEERMEEKKEIMAGERRRKWEEMRVQWKEKRKTVHLGKKEEEWEKIN